MGRLTVAYRIYPSKKQIKRLDSSFALAAELYNIFLDECKRAYETNGERLGKYDLCNKIIEIKEKDPRFTAVHSQVLQNCADRLHKAFDNFFRCVKEKKKGAKIKVGYPRYKRRVKSITYPQDGFKIKPDVGQIYISKIGNVPAVIHRPIPGQIKTMTIVKKRSGEWYVLFSCITDDGVHEDTLEKPEIGIDLGLNCFASFSDGSQLEMPKLSKREEKMARLLRRRIDRKEDYSKNREKARIKLARATEKITARRHDFLHKASTGMVNRYGTIALESLDIKDLICQSCRPNDINQSAWGMFTRMIEYKAERAGSRVMRVNRYDPTSQICSACGIRGHIGPRQKTFHCESCGLRMDRDINAAKNILHIALNRAGHARINAWGEKTSTPPSKEVRVPSLNQEPYTEGFLGWNAAEGAEGCHSHSTVGQFMTSGHSHSTVAGGLWVMS